MKNFMIYVILFSTDFLNTFKSLQKTCTRSEVDFNTAQNVEFVDHNIKFWSKYFQWYVAKIKLEMTYDFVKFSGPRSEIKSTDNKFPLNENTAFEAQRLDMTYPKLLYLHFAQKLRFKFEQTNSNRKQKMKKQILVAAIIFLLMLYLKKSKISSSNMKMT